MSSRLSVYGRLLKTVFSLGDVDEADPRGNELALREGFRLLSVYRSTDNTKFWLITEADRRLTCILLPEDY